MSLRKPPTLTSALLAANRRNAQKSTGPRTEEGKCRVILNGLKHGLRSRSFRDSLVKSGESTALVDRNFLFLTLYLLPQKRYEVHRIARFVRTLWSATHWGRRHEVRPAGPERLFWNITTDLQLQLRLMSAENQMTALKQRRRCGPPDPESHSESTTSPTSVPSPIEMNLLRRTGPILLPGLELLVQPQPVKGLMRRREPANPESRLESMASMFAPPSPFPKPNPKGQAAGVAGLAIAKAKEASKRAQPVDKNEPPKPESCLESAASMMGLSWPSPIPKPQANGQAAGVPNSAGEKTTEAGHGGAHPTNRSGRK